ncbi:MAG: right-handed parallel beta-helix repeat-containing protein [Candidatus Altiarchaeales archaeon]|nr:right-handed parallel beta-helix repeat-containing protein [Candidatus Altiarchaeota archaeon]MBU4341998.1 right-handed parallel beta-helix repeat-containing protein [Candidatus Altiarchaeota archaeon]MBU4406566.1 right-handed parallel beta-helix repeat-containing protein [Candidatus Altiarchaeota archaeon]MCG2782014.1 right-handed parallel beta-helix repeat-containing protein [Candidatus Altiarchaeales archaeon]
MKRYLLLIILLAGFAGGASYNCSSCEDCNGKIQNASAGDTVYLTANITNQSETCIEFNQTDGITFDCQQNKIGGLDNYEYGILMENSNNNVIGNCTIRDFSFAMLLDNSSNNEIINNSLSYCDLGIKTQHPSHNNTISLNVISHNIADGLRIVLEYP